MSEYVIYNGSLYSTDELYHHGVKGMKWGVRRYQNKDGSLTAKGIKRYAKKQYAKDAINSNKTALGKAYDLYTGAHKIRADNKYKTASNKKNKESAEKYVRDMNKQQNAPLKQKAAKVAAKGAVKSAKILNKIGKAYLTDQLFFGGAGTKLAKETVIATGRAAVTAYTMARGGYDIKWYDKHGRRVG